MKARLLLTTLLLGVTDISVEYSSPAVRGGKVYENVISKGCMASRSKYEYNH